MVAIRSPSEAGPANGERPGEAAVTLRFRLRHETRAAHARLDGAFARLGQPDGANDYRRFLATNAACLVALIPPLAASGLTSQMPHIAPDIRARAALADLAALGIPAPATPVFALPRPSLFEAVGIAYVLEGSRLGARAILKALRAASSRLDTAAPVPTSFLEASSGSEGFRTFLDRAEAIAETQAQRDAAVRAADTTFLFFLDAERGARGPQTDGTTT